MKPLHTGLSLSTTVAVFYSLCALAEVAFPDAFTALMNAIFHNVDFGKIISSQTYTWVQFFSALIVLAAWAFAAGAFYAWIYNVFAETRFTRIVPRH